jgi:RNA polymerase sigma-54 factor
MTPQLQQAIKLLQLSNVELGEFVDQELERNPLLERAEGEETPTPEPAVAESRVNGEERLLDPVAGPAGDEAPLDVHPTDQYGDDGAESGMGGGGAASMGSWGNGGGQGFDDEDGSLERTLARPTTLRDHLRAQIQVDLTDPREAIIGGYLVEQVDEAGYLRIDRDALAATLGCARSLIDQVIAKLQRLDPPGVFAADLKECLALQLADRNRLDPAMAALLDNLDLVARRDNATLLRRCGVEAQDLADMLTELRTLNPKPGLIFDTELPPPVVPDVLVRQASDGGWHVELNSETLPRLLVNERYYARVSGSVRNRGEKDYLAERFSSANWLVKSLDQRARTILRVAREIVRQQDAFLVYGIQHLRPLVLRDIAEAVEMHESTISRVTNNKYMTTPRGVFELKYFFTSGLSSTEGGDMISAESVRHRIRALIDEEPAEDVLSDDRLVEILRGEGIDIARRTVAKYREALRIPSSVQRRRDKKLFATA